MCPSDSLSIASGLHRRSCRFVAQEQSLTLETFGRRFHNEQEMSDATADSRYIQPRRDLGSHCRDHHGHESARAVHEAVLAFLPKVVQTWLPSLVAGLPAAVNAFESVKTWLDFAQAVLVVGTIPLALVAPGLSSPHDDPEKPEPPAPPPAIKRKGGDKPEPPSVPPLAAAGLFLLCWLLPGCGLFATSDPRFGQAAVFIADAGNAVSAAEALLPSLKLDSKEAASAQELIARARAALSAAAAANNGAKDLTAEQLDASLAAFRAAWVDIQQVISRQRIATTDAPVLPTPVCMGTVGK